MSLKITNRLLFISAVLFIFILIPSSFAGELNENQTIDTLGSDDSTQDSIVTADNDVIYVSPTASGGDGSQNNPYNLATAVSVYDSTVNSKIIMKNGEYNFTEQLILNKNINIEGESYNGVILNGVGQTSILKATSGNIVLSNLKFVNGYSEYAPYYGYDGGALHIGRVNHILIDNCIFENNTASAITAGSSNALIDIQNCEFNDNHVDGDWSARGGAINAGAQDIVMNVINTTFKNNYVVAERGSGGAVYGALNFKSFVFDNCIFINNTAPDEGSAIAAYCGGNISVFNSQFINQTPSVIHDDQVNSKYLTLFIKNLTFDKVSDENVVIEGKVNLVDLDVNTRMSANNIEMRVGDDENYTVTFTDGNGKPIDGKLIVVTLTNYYNQVTTLNATTNTTGHAVFSMKNQTPGRYKVVASFAGDAEYGAVETNNQINIQAKEMVSLIMVPDSIKLKEGDSYVVTGYIVDIYYEPDDSFYGSSVTVEWNNPTKRSLSNAAVVYWDSFTFDISECSLKTNKTPYVVTFIVDSYNEEVISALEGYLIVDMSVDVPDVGDIDVIHVAVNGSDENGNGSEDNPLATVQMALNLNKALGGGKTIVVGEGTYDISNFNIQSDVTIVGTKSKTIFRQTSGRDGMFKVFDPVTVNLVNLTLIDGYTTPQPYSLITAYGEGVLINIDGCEFRNNTCLAGGVIAISHGAYVYVNNSKFIDNRGILIQSAGGAIYVLDGYLKATGCEFINNTACDGGAIYIGGSGTADIIDSTFTDNIEYNGTVVIGGGGAIYNKGIANIKNSSFIRNFADLYGGAIYIAGGKTTISQSYFENNTVGIAQTTGVKGSAIQSESYRAIDLDVEYSIFLTNSGYHYQVLLSDVEDSTVNLNHNYWGSNEWRGMNTNVVVTDYAIIQARSETSPVYKNLNTSIDVEFKNYHKETKAITSLNGNVHDYTIDISSQLNDINSTTVTIVNNFAQVAYYPENVGLENITVKDSKFSFEVKDTTKKDVNPKITIKPGNTTTIIVEVPTDLENNISISVKNDEFSRPAGNGTIAITLDTVPGDYRVVVSYEEDSVYKGFSNTTSFSIPKYKSVLNVSAGDVYDDQSATVDVNITKGATGTVTIIINGKSRYPAEIANGKAFKVFYDLTVGNYTVDVIYEGDDYYEGSNASTTFNVFQRPPEPVEPVDGYAYIRVQTGSVTTISVRVPDELMNNITITVNNTEYSVKSVDGTVVLNVTTETPGEYPVVVNYDGDEYYKPFSAETSFKIYDYCWFINETGYRTLREAVDAAGNGDVIKGNLSVYEIDETIDIGHRYMPSEPWEIVKNVTITSMTETPVTIKGVSNRLFFVDSNSTLTLNNLILTGSNIGYLDGGAVENMYDAYVNILNCTFTNFTADRGGALFLWGQALVKDSIFIDNYAEIGGAIFVLSPVTNDNNVIFDNITVVNNSALSYGAGLYIQGSAYNTTIIKNSNFTNNIGHGHGGALFVSYGEVIIDNTVFDSNSILDYEFDSEVVIAGGGVFISKDVNANISNSKFINNYAEGYGGALVCNNAKFVIQDLMTGEEEYYCFCTNIMNCSFIENTAGVSAGAIFVGLDDIATVNIDDSIFDSNKASEAAAISSSLSYLTIKNTEFTNNIASNASLIATYGYYYEEAFNAETEIIDCTFENNDVSYDIYQKNFYTILTVEYSNFTDDAVVLANYGTATLNNVVQKVNNSDYAIVNYNGLYLSKNSFINPINNYAKILTQTYIVVLDNETKSGEINKPYTLKAIVCDDNGNIIEKGNLTFVVEGNEIEAIYNNGEFSADYILANGSHIVSAKYSDVGLSELTVKTAVLIAKNPVDMSIEIKDIEFGENATIIARVNSDASGNVTLKINNKTYEMPIKKGEAKFIVSDLEIGSYPVEITYSGDDKYAEKTVSDIQNVTKIHSYPFEVKAFNITTNSAVINITLPSDFNGNVTVIVDRISQEVEVKDGNALLPLSHLATGSHDVEVVFDGTDKYAKSTAKTSFNVFKLESFVKIIVNDVVFGETAVINFVVPNDATGAIIVSVDNKEYLPIISNGVATLSIPDLEIGEYDVEALYVGDSVYLDSINKTSFNVINKTVIKNTVIKFTIYGTNITGVLKEVDGNPISNAEIKYAVNGANASVVTGEDGTFVIQSQPGATVDINYAGDNNTLPYSASIAIEGAVEPPAPVNVISTKFDFESVLFIKGYAVDTRAGEKGIEFITCLLDANGKPLANKTVQLAVNSKVYDQTTNTTGGVHYFLNMMKAGRYTMTYVFLGDSEYGSCLASACVDLDKKPITIKASAKSYKATAKTKKYTVTLSTIVGSSADGKAHLRSGLKVTLTLNGKTYTAKINSKGQATFNLKITKKGKYTASIKYAGDDTYKAANKSVKITIN
ncbi:MAG: Ig-like domain repeat protein [Methanobrevibacter sp.]|nr:Ig-like domain repeat protein [Methanobrevibacter sp.]